MLNVFIFNISIFNNIQLKTQKKIGSNGGRSSSGFDEKSQSWVRAIQGQARQPSWTLLRSLKQRLRNYKYFTKVLKFSKQIMEVSLQKQENVSIITLSLGQQVPIKWVAKDFKERGKLQEEVERLSLMEDHLLFYIKSVEWNAFLK